MALASLPAPAQCNPFFLDVVFSDNRLKCMDKCCWLYQGALLEEEAWPLLWVGLSLQSSNVKIHSGFPPLNNSSSFSPYQPSLPTSNQPPSLTLKAHLCFPTSKLFFLFYLLTPLWKLEVSFWSTNLSTSLSFLELLMAPYYLQHKVQSNILNMA